MINYFFEILLATFLGLLIGLERKIKVKDPGVRTFAFVTLGSALFVILGKLIAQSYNLNALDPTRILGQIIVGIGFLGAGIIFFEETEKRFKGLTTASMLWVSAAIGSAVGLGYYQVAIFTALLIIGVNIIIYPLEMKLNKKLEEKNK